MKACNSCGKCCTKYGDGQLAASDDDIDLWDSLRPEIARYTKSSEIWFDPDSGSRLRSCPWLTEVPGSSVFHCAIYFDRPEDCRIYPATVADMIKDDCEMLEPKDLKNTKLAEIQLSQIHIADR